jgi:cysteine desulfurase family protein (TIGR01976 family)
MNFKPQEIRSEFPGLASGAIFLDNPAGTQVPQNVIDRMVQYLRESNANHGGAFKTSQVSDALIDETRQALAEFINAASPNEIIFGPSMTGITLHMSRSIAKWLNPGDEIIVTRLDHDANITPWTIIAEERGCKVRWLDFDVEDFTLKVEQYADLLSERTRLVCIGYASNALGTINPVVKMAHMAREAGALSFIDAVQYAPHGPIDVQSLGCDFLVMSAYKFFGPHVGIMYGKKEHLEALPAYKVRPAPDHIPDRFETGTKNHEGIAGTLGAIEYLAEIGTRFGDCPDIKETGRIPRKTALRCAMRAIQSYEKSLSARLIRTLSQIPGLTIWGITDEDRLDERVPTLAFTMEGHSPLEIATYLGKKGIYTWNGNYYALAVTDRLGLEGSGGMLRVGPVHYNTVDEIDKLGEALLQLS